MMGAMSTLHRGHFSTESCAGVAMAAATPQCGQCRLPMNIMPKHEPHEIVATFDSQNWHFDESEEIAAPQLGQLRVCASIDAGGAISVCADIQLNTLVSPR
jgi:hypothetical protein